jgi:hypothetical protein
LERSSGRRGPTSVSFVVLSFSVFLDWLAMAVTMKPRGPIVYREWSLGAP